MEPGGAQWGGPIGFAIILFIVTSLVLRSRFANLPVWSIMSFSAFITVITGLVSFDEVGYVIDVDVILFLIGMFSLVSLAETSGLLSAVSAWFVSMFKSRYGLLYASSLLFGLLAAFAVNDTVALVGPPIAYAMSRAAGLDYRLMFLLLAYSLTVGSAMTPIGNPQNVLIAIQSGIPAPFVTFAKKLAVPTLVNLVLVPYLLIKIFRVEDGPASVGLVPQELIKDRRDAVLAGASLLTAVMALVINDVLDFFGLPHIAHRGFIPFVVAAGTYLLARNPRRVIAGVDWGSIVFFMTMFIAMEGVWRSGVLNPLLSALVPAKLGGAQGLLAISAASLLLSQVLSNVPLVKLFMEFLKDSGYGPSDVGAWIALATSSTIAGNLTILGAASNVIILETLETRMGTSISFMEFSRVGVIVTAVNIAVYIPFLLLA